MENSLRNVRDNIFHQQNENKDPTMNTRRYPNWKLAKATGYCLKQTTAATYHGN